MDFVTINKLSQNRKVKIARDCVYGSKAITVDDSLVLIVYACKKMYGIGATAKIIHGLGVDKF